MIIEQISGVGVVMHWSAKLFGFLLAGSAAAAQAEPLKLYIDADFTASKAVAYSIERGVKAALARVDGEIGGYKIEVVRRDHNGNSKRSRYTFGKFAKDESGLVVIGGKQSPPYLTYRKYINSNRLLALLPWSAAGPVTRPPQGEENWMFRLSVDDAKAGPFLVSQTLEAGCQNVGLVLVNTGWGRANAKSMTAAFAKAGRRDGRVTFFPGEIGDAGGQKVADDVLEGGEDCIILLAGSKSGAAIMERLAAHDEPPKVFSHWGILGGGFERLTTHGQRDKLRLRVLQTCGLAVEARGSNALEAALEADGRGVRSLSELSAPAGFVHGYDLTNLLIEAGAQAARNPQWRDAPVEQKRLLLKEALENLERPVAGILKSYQQPFSPYSLEARDAHEALGADQLCMATFSADGRLQNASMPEVQQ